MKRTLAIAFFTIAAGLVFSCKKDAKMRPAIPAPSLESGLTSFSANGQLTDADIDTMYNTVTFVLGDSANYQAVTINFTLTTGVIAKINGSPVQSGSVIDFTKPVTLQLSSADGRRPATFTVTAQTKLQYFGIAGNVTARKSLNRPYNFYMDQFDGSTYQGFNCGPASSSMAIKWADSTFNKTPAYARGIFLDGGGWWQTGDIQGYLNKYNISNGVDTLGDVDAVVKKEIDAGNALILCLDMFYVPQNMTDYQHIQKFYEANTVGWGHFILIKGYVKAGQNFYLEAYDPYSDMRTYAIVTPGQLKGKDRYYLDGDIKVATMKWWPYVITVASKGKVISSQRSPSVFSIHRPIPQASGR
ncbi:MAG: hypothetical protein JST32_02305 [Bacteroidetes bacterium]|nr:hypothetical protein [Bacteroidota bacterium]